MNSLPSNMSSNMKIKYNKYRGLLERINKLIFIAVVFDPRYNRTTYHFYFRIYMMMTW